MNGAPQGTSSPPSSKSYQPDETSSYPKVTFESPHRSSSYSDQFQPVAAAAAASEMEDETRKKRGTHLMGYPAVPTVHPDNQKAATWNAGDHHHPYLIYSPLDKPPTNNPLDPLVRKFHAWTTQAETLAQNIWHNLKTGPSVSEAAWGKVNLTAKAIQEGGFESLYKQVFEPFPNDTLKKTFACYLSTTTGPVAGTLYLSTHRVAFASDRPLSFTAPYNNYKL